MKESERKLIEVDVAVIGAGSAGLPAWREVKKNNKKVVLIEAGPYGTTCARVGCMPSKLLIQAADAAHEIKHASRFGIEVNPQDVHIHGAQVLKRVQSMRDQFVAGVLKSVEAIPASEKLTGFARFHDSNTLLVGDDDKVKARSFVIAVGSTPFIPDEYQGLGDRLLTNDSVFEMQELPSSVAVIGAGVIALELGQALHRLGVQVDIFNRNDQIGPLSDPEVNSRACQYFCQEMPMHMSATVTSVARHPSFVELSWQQDGKQFKKQFEKILVAAGRIPNLQGLNLEALGFEGRGLVKQIDQSTMQLAQSHLFFAGDVTGTRALLHEASDEGRIAGQNAASFPEIKKFKRSVPLAVVFSDPQMGIVGKSYHELNLSQILIGAVNFEDQGRAKVMGQNRGMAHVYADKSSGVVLGAEVLGPRAEHLAHLLAWCVQQNLTVAEMLEMPFYHPVIEEGLRTALRDLAAQLRKSSRTT